MIDLFYWTTPNGHKITMFLEEAKLPYKIHPVNISKGEQFQPEFLKIAPNNRIPAIVDNEPIGGGKPLSIFESGAILEYLAEKTGKFLPKETHAKWEVKQWLYWQMAGFGPMLGQNHHFNLYAPEKIQYAIDRYVNESHRLYRVLNERLTGREWIGDEYSIADMAAYPWAVPHEKQGIDLAKYPALKTWFERIGKRPATIAAYEKARAINTAPSVSEDAKKILFGQR